MPINVLIADDHAIVRIGLRKILQTQRDIIVIGEAADGHEALALAMNRDRPCDLIIMDIAMPGINGIDATRTIREYLKEIKIVILSMYDTSEHIHRAFQSGADGYLLKGVAGDEIITAIRAVVRGDRYYGKGVATPVSPEQTQEKNLLDLLSKREREVLQLVVAGKSSAEIAEILSLAGNTPDVYRSRIMKKLRVKNTASLVKLTMQIGAPFQE
jgi:DNA-binding NarL/FixJ family response regulator